jgi:hypothetical protein
MIASLGLAMPAGAIDDTPIIDGFCDKAADGNVAQLGTFDQAPSAATPARGVLRA